MDLRAASARLLDEVQAELARREVDLGAELFVCGVFGDLLWAPYGTIDYSQPPGGDDPAFQLTGFTRLVGMARLVGELRFYASPIPEGAPSWWWTGEDSARVDAVKAEADEREIVVLRDVSDAVTFTISYLGGMPLRDIPVIRCLPDFSEPAVSRAGGWSRGAGRSRR